MSSTRSNVRSVAIVFLLAGCFTAAGLGAPAWAADVCGDGIVTGGEQCDDGNLADGDGCRATCQWPLGDVGDLTSDDFNACALDARWEVVNPLGVGSAEISGAGSGAARLDLGLPAGVAHDAWALTGNEALRVLQTLSIEPGDLELEVNFDSEPTGDYADQGLLIEQDSLTYLRFDVYHTGASLYVFGGRTVGGANVFGFNTPIAAGLGHYLRATRAGDLWTLWLSADGSSWKRAGTLTQQMTVERLGVFVANPVRGTEYTASVDWLFNVADPVDPEDGATFDCGCIDLDGDGYGEGDSCLGTDCNDSDPDVHPLSTDFCDGVDNDCDGVVDDDDDLDGDGVSVCQGDCDDNNADVFPGNDEFCDGLDNDCDGFIDEGLTSLTLMVQRQDHAAELWYRGPYSDADVSIFDRAPGSCAREQCGASAQQYACILESCAPVPLVGSGAPAVGITDASGMVTFDLAAGDYLAIVAEGTSQHFGKTVGELECGDHRLQPLRVVIPPRRVVSPLLISPSRKR